MKLFNIIPVISLLPLLSGCITYNAIQTAKTPVYKIQPDKVFRVEKAAISDNKLLLIYLDGCLSNSPKHIQFTVNIPLKEIATKSEIKQYFPPPPITNFATLKTYGALNLSRDTIHSGWIAQSNSNGNWEPVPVGMPIPPPTDADIRYRGESAYGESAKLLPDAKRTLYILSERKGAKTNDWPAPLDFIFVDASSNQKYTIIRMQKATALDNQHKAAYALLPLTVSLDIATSPFQLIGLGFMALMLSGMGHNC